MSEQKKLKAGWIGFLREELNTWENLETLAKLGYQGLEGGNSLIVEGDVKENLKRLYDMGLRILTESMDSNALYENPKETVAEAIKRAKRADTDRVTLWACDINANFWGREPSYDRFMKECELMEEAAVEMKKEGITLCYHNHYQDFAVTFKGVQGFDHMLLNTETLKFEPDIAWITNGNMNVCETLRRIAPRLASIHVKDYVNGEPREGFPGVYVPTFTTVGTGIVDIAGGLKTAAELGVEWAVVEQDEMRNLDAMTTLTTAYYNMKEMGYVE